MKTNPGNTIVTLLALGLLGTTLAAQQPTAPAQTESNDATTTLAPSPVSVSPSTASLARIMRLSDVEGAVQIDRNTGQGFEGALLNLPITQGATLRTTVGRAEVEFEDGSTLRIIPSTTIGFPQLELLNSGTTATTVNLREGTIYVNLAGAKSKEFALIFGSQKLTLKPSSHIRLHLGHTKAKLAVFNGDVQVVGPSGTMAVGKKKTLTFDLSGQNEPILTKDVAQNKYDVWDQQAINYHKSYAKSAAYGKPPYAYGVPDLNYYGSFVNAPGCGSVWRPFFASVGWDPYMNGTWAWYPASGYSWVSPYPWGWIPFHSGDWEYCPAYGWGWRPSRLWVGLKNPPRLVKPRLVEPRHGIRVPRPPRPPSGGPHLVAVNRAPRAVSTLTPQGFVVRNDSAGLGVPRDSLGNVGELSRQVEQHGSVSLPIASALVAGESRTADGASGSLARPGFAFRTGSAESSRSSMAATHSSDGRPLARPGSASRTGSAGPSHSSTAAAHSSGGMGSRGASSGMGHMGGGGGSMSSSGRGGGGSMSSGGGGSRAGSSAPSPRR
jgi:hypothetical protein